MTRENRKWANKIKKAAREDKDSLFLDATETLDKDAFLKDIVRDIPCGEYHLNSGEENSIIDMLLESYGNMISWSIDATFFIGLSIYCDSGRKVNGKKFHATFTHDLNKISITA
jgi:hypothetical protein